MEDMEDTEEDSEDTVEDSEDMEAVEVALLKRINPS